MTTKTTWKGVFPAAATQFNKDLSLDLDLTTKHLQILIDSGVFGLVMLGSLGENVTLSLEEKREVIRSAVSVANGKVPILSGVAELNTAAAIKWVQELEKLGVDGAMVMPAMAFRPDPEEIVAHYGAIARSTSLPLMIYNNPIAYHADVTPDLLSVLAEQANYIAIKESCGDPRRLTDIYNQVGNRFTLFAGVDDLILESVLLGAEGWVAGAGLAFPAENQRLWELATSGQWERARNLYRWFAPLLHLDIGTKFVQNIKLAIQEVGLGREWVRLPRLPLTGASREKVLAVVRKGIETRPSL
jgi:4-hydroxy-tetrahydrodipicolinate synthase